MGLRFRDVIKNTSNRETVPSLSMIVPLKGADDFTASHLKALVESEVDIPVEYLFTMESMNDPAFEVCQKVKGEHADKDIRIILSGPANGRMGKQHNLEVATQQSRYKAIGSMDADVLVETDTLAVGLRYLALSSTGIAYFLPAYYGPGPTGGLLVALYSNYYYQLSMGALALAVNAPFITGALWLVRKEILDHMRVAAVHLNSQRRCCDWQSDTPTKLEECAYSTYCQDTFRASRSVWWWKTSSQMDGNVTFRGHPNFSRDPLILASHPVVIYHNRYRYTAFRIYQAISDLRNISTDLSLVCEVSQRLDSQSSNLLNLWNAKFGPPTDVRIACCANTLR